MKITKSGLSVKSSIKAGLGGFNHNRTVLAGLAVKSSIKAGLAGFNHNRALLG
jgi:hypothetical protein